MVYFWLGRRGESDTNNSKSSLGMVLTFLLDEIIKSTADSNAPSFSVFLRCFKVRIRCGWSFLFLGWQAIIRAWLVFGVGRATAPRKFKVPRKHPSPSDHTATLKGRSGFVYLNSTRQGKERNWWKRDDRGQSHPEESAPTRSTLIAAKEARLNEDGRQDLEKETPKHTTDGRNTQEHLGGLVHWHEYLNRELLL